MDTSIVPQNKEKHGGITGKGFIKGDPRINRNGRARKFVSKKDADLFSLYGIRLSDYNEIFERQNGVCAICKNPETITQARNGTKGVKVPSSLQVDHDHETGKVRGLICWKCNVGVVKVLDNKDLVLAAAKYLRIKVDYGSSD